MQRLSVRHFSFKKHVETGLRLAALKKEFRSIAATFAPATPADPRLKHGTGFERIALVAVKADAWIGRLIAALDSQCLRDYPHEYSSGVYFPPESAKPVTERLELTAR